MKSFLSIKKLLLSLALVPGIAFAQTYSSTGQTLGQVSSNISSSLVGVNAAVEAFAYVAALIFVVLGILKFKAHRDDPRSTPLGTPIAIWICAGLFAFAPMLINTAGATLWGAGATSVKAPSASIIR